MPHALVFNLPVKTSLKLMLTVSSDSADPEGKLFNHIIDVLDRTNLVMLRIDLQSPNPCRIIDGSILVYSLIMSWDKKQE